MQLEMHVYKMACCLCSSLTSLECVILVNVHSTVCLGELELPSVLVAWRGSPQMKPYRAERVTLRYG